MFSNRKEVFCLKSFSERYDRLHDLISAYAEEKTACYTARSTALEECYRALRDNRFVTLVGSPGMGTSSLLFAFGKKYAERYNIFRVVCAFDATTDLVSDVLRFLVHELENALGTDHSAYTADDEAIRHTFSVLTARLYRRTGKECLFLLDEADLLKIDIAELDPPPYARFIAVSHRDADQHISSFVLSVQTLSCEEACSILSAQLRAHGVEPRPALLEAAMKKSNMHNCSFIKMMAQKLENAVKVDGKSDDDLIDIVNEMPDALGWDVYVFTTEVGAATTYTMQKGAMALLVLGRHGFGRELLRYTFANGGLIWDEALFDRVLTMLKAYFFIDRNGVIRLASPWLRDTLYTCFGGGTHEISGQILTWLKQLDVSDETRADELLHHCRLCGDSAAAASYLTEIASSGDDVLRAVTAREIRKLLFYDQGEWLLELIRLCDPKAVGFIGDALNTPLPQSMAPTLCQIYKALFNAGRNEK
ncbi:MAG: hypothetical protein KIG36_02395 [Eubacteriales bacterium]|nr:hypothetical protein [Eubacteriales bacterium]